MTFQRAGCIKAEAAGYHTYWNGQLSVGRDAGWEVHRKWRLVIVTVVYNHSCRHNSEQCQQSRDESYRTDPIRRMDTRSRQHTGSTSVRCPLRLVIIPTGAPRDQHDCAAHDSGVAQIVARIRWIGDEERKLLTDRVRPVPRELRWHATDLHMRTVRLLTAGCNAVCISPARAGIPLSSLMQRARGRRRRRSPQSREASR